jgi:hypothetical protein
MRALALAALIAANLAGIWSWQTIHRQPPGPHGGLQCFAEKVLARTEPGASVRFVLPASEGDGGLINHRLRYALPGRYVSTNLDMFAPTRRPDWIATWNATKHGGCDGSLERAGSR